MLQGLKNIYHLFMAVLANVWYGFPSRKIIVIGVTGTDGKTTTVSLIYHILKTAGFNTSMISSIGAFIGGEEYDVGFHVTTPSPFALQAFIKKAVNVNSKYLVLEVTSHAFDQNRVWGINFEVGVITNVTREHLDYHKTYENYLKTKTRLLQIAKKSLINRDDNSFGVISNLKSQISNLVTYGLKRRADINPYTFPFKTNLLGEFNKYNCLAAIAVCQALGINDSAIRRGISTFKLPIGRAEVVYQKDFTVMIDFAHTTNALEQILSSIRPQVKGRLIHVFGSAGKRDHQKRPLMGKASARYADVIILTAEDPRSESVKKIIDEIESGIMNYESRIKNGSLLKISDRQEAIMTSIKMAERGDLVLITGKGHEKSMNLGGGEIPWSEHEAVKKAFKDANKKF